MKETSEEREGSRRKERYIRKRTKERRGRNHEGKNDRQ
jgi:hypothetical protein